MTSRTSAGNRCYYYLKHIMNPIAIMGLKINIYKIMVKPVEFRGKLYDKIRCMDKKNIEENIYGPLIKQETRELEIIKKILELYKDIQYVTILFVQSGFFKLKRQLMREKNYNLNFFYYLHFLQSTYF